MFAKIKLLLVTSRPIFWLGPVFIYILSLIAGHIQITAIIIWGLFWVTFPMGLIVYGLNDIADAKSDQINPRKGRVEGNVLKNADVKFLIYTITAICFISIYPFIAMGYLLSLIPIVLIIVFAYVYSFKPFHLKSRPFIDSLSNAAWMVLIFIFGYSFHSKTFSDLLAFPQKVWALAIGVFATHALTTLMDYEVDKKNGDATIGVFLKIKTTALLCFSIYTTILLILQSLNLAFKLYLVTSAALCLIIAFKSRPKLIHAASWIILIGFPIVAFYSLVFDFAFIKNFLSLNSALTIIK